MTTSAAHGTLRVATRIDRVDVYKGQACAGVLERTKHGALFRYAPDYLERAAGDPRRAVAFTLPLRSEPYEVFGTNLPPFFAGLLPEGLRLRALRRSLKTSEDDLFSMLVASGADTVGDVAVALPGAAAPADQAPVADTEQLSKLSFAELLEQSLRYAEGGGDAAIAGVQPKVSAAMITLPIRARHRRQAYFLKLTPADYPRLVENEAFFMQVAKASGVEVAHTKLVCDRTAESALLVERFDRIARSDGSYERLHQEDACQLLDRYPADKYRLSLRELMNALEVCSAPTPERLKLLRLQAFAYLIANGDMHAKNVSVYTRDGRTTLTPAYDLLSTLPYGDAKLALELEGRSDRLTRQHFTSFGERVGLRAAAVTQMLDRLCARVAQCLPKLPAIGLSSKQEQHLRRIMQARLSELAATR